jgi:hypothetical protein
MRPRRYSLLLNFAWYQLLWFCAVLGGDLVTWLLLPMLLAHLLQVDDWRGELLLMLAVAGLGGTFDAVLTAAGYFAFDPAPAVLPIPLWLVAIWMGFAGTLRHSMRFMVSHPRVMTLAAGCFAPLTYMAAGRLGAVDFPLGPAPTAVAVGLSWLALSPALVWLAHTVEWLRAPEPELSKQLKTLGERS